MNFPHNESAKGRGFAGGVARIKKGCWEGQKRKRPVWSRPLADLILVGIQGEDVALIVVGQLGHFDGAQVGYALG